MQKLSARLKREHIISENGSWGDRLVRFP